MVKTYRAREGYKFCGKERHGVLLLVHKSVEVFGKFPVLNILSPPLALEINRWKT